MTWKREKRYSKYRERIRWLEWEIKQKDIEIEKLRKYAPKEEIIEYEPAIKVPVRC